MRDSKARDYAMTCFVNVYLRDPLDTEPYFRYCRELRDGTRASDEYSSRHLAHLDLYERTEQGDFDYWLTSPDKIKKLVEHAARTRRCDVIERYAPQLPNERFWNMYVSLYYNSSLYPILSTVMALPVTLTDAIYYVRRGLHREVMVHIVGRADCRTGETITLARIACWYCAKVSTTDELLALEGVGLDLTSPRLLYIAVCYSNNGPIIPLLRERCSQVGALDVITPNGKTLREMRDDLF